MSPKAIQRVSPKELFYVVLAFLAVNLFVAATQPRLQVKGGMGWDGEVFVQMAQQMAQGQRPEETAPFIYQPGTSFLVALFHPKDMVAGFQWVNIAGGFFLVVLLAFWLGLWVEDRWIRLALNFSLQTTAVGPVCFVWFYPALTDHWPTVFILAGLLWMALRPSPREAALGLSVLCFTGIFFREVLFALPLAFLFRGFRWDSPGKSLWNDIHWKVLPLLAALAGWGVLHLCVRDTNTLHWSYWEKAWELMRAHSPGRWVLAWFSAYGPLLFAVVLRPARVAAFLKERPELLVFLGAVAALTFLSSGEDRYFFWLSPVVYAAVGIALETEGSLLRGWGMGTFLVLAQAVSQRLFWITPPQWPADSTPGLPVFLTPVGPDVNYFDVVAVLEKSDVAQARLLQYACLGGFFFLAQKWKDSKAAGGRKAAPRSRKRS